MLEIVVIVILTIALLVMGGILIFVLVHRERKRKEHHETKIPRQEKENALILTVEINPENHGNQQKVSPTSSTVRVMAYHTEKQESTSSTVSEGDLDRLKGSMRERRISRVPELSKNCSGKEMSLNAESRDIHISKIADPPPQPPPPPPPPLQPPPPPPPPPPRPPSAPPKILRQPIKKEAKSTPNELPSSKKLSKPAASSHSAPLTSGDNKVSENIWDTPPKLKPLFWEKIKANGNESLVWDKFSGSFEANEAMIELLFGINQKPSVNVADQPTRDPPKQKQVLHPRKAQNIAIQLRALDVTKEEIYSSLLEGTGLSSEALEALVKMEPTKEEGQWLREYADDPSKLGPIEQFLKNLLEIPCAFRRLNALKYMVNFKDELEQIHGSFDALECACKELKNSHTFAKILQAVLKTGNKMNMGTSRGEAQGFKIDSLLKLPDVKGVDGKTTLLHFIAEEIMIAEGLRVTTILKSELSSSTKELNSIDNYRQLGSKVILGLSSELVNVERAARTDLVLIKGSISNLVDGLEELKHDIQCQYKESCNRSHSVSSFQASDKFSESVRSFLEKAELEVVALKKEMTRIYEVVQKTNTYFYGDVVKEETNLLTLFTVVKTFMTMLSQACIDVIKSHKA